ncbi:MAG: cytochrome c [Bradyrhizobium sp.]
MVGRFGRAWLAFGLLVPICVVAADRLEAGDVKAGRAKAMMCQACHGLDGLSKVPDAPNIAGQTEPYLVTQLHAFKDGIRKNDAMSVVAPSLSDQDIDDLAAYFSAIEVAVVKIPGG